MKFLRSGKRVVRVERFCACGAPIYQGRGRRCSGCIERARPSVARGLEKELVALVGSAWVPLKRGKRPCRLPLLTRREAWVLLQLEDRTGLEVAADLQISGPRVSQIAQQARRKLASR